MTKTHSQPVSRHPITGEEEEEDRDGGEEELIRCQLLLIS